MIRWNGTLHLDLVRHSSEARITLISPVLIEDCPLLWMVVRSQTYYPEHILAYGSGKARYALVMGSGSFWTDWLEAGKGGGLSTILRPVLKCGGLESKFRWGPKPHDRSRMGWSCLCLGYKRGVCFGVPSWDTLVHESPYDMVRLAYDLAPSKN